MIRIMRFGLVLVTVAGCNAFKPYESVVSGPRATVEIQTNAGELGVLVFVPDANCKFSFVGRTKVMMREPAGILYMPPGRTYFRVSPDLPYTTIGLKDVSFVLEEGKSYRIEFNKLGSSAGWTGAKIEYEINYLDLSGEFPAPIAVDHFDVCKRT